jgi:hypothetical protein
VAPVADRLPAPPPHTAGGTAYCPTPPLLGVAHSLGMFHELGTLEATTRSLESAIIAPSLKTAMMTIRMLRTRALVGVHACVHVCGGG